MDEGFIVYEKNESLIEEDSFSFLLSEIIKHSDNQSDRNTNSPEYKKQKIEANKELFLLLIKQLHTLVGNTLSTQIPNKLDDKRKKEYEQCQQDWNTTIGCIDFLERQIKETTNSLLEAFHADENGELHNDCAMINCTGFEDVSGCEERFVPVVLAEHLFSLLDKFCLFSICTMYAKNVQCAVDSLFENDLQMRTDMENEMKEIFLKTLSNEIKLDNLNKKLDENQRQSNIHDQKLDTIGDKLEKKNKAGKYKPLKLTTCLDAISEVYKEFNYSRQFELHLFAIKKMLSAWNQYLKTDGEKGQPPLPQFDFYRTTTKELFKEWVKTVFFPYYRDHSHKRDALRSASHPANMDNLYVQSQQDIIEEVDESFDNEKRCKY